MELINYSRELTKKEIYKMTKDQGITSVKDAIGNIVNVDAWLLYSDLNNRTNETQEILSILCDDGSVYATISKTFIGAFFDIVEIMEGEDFAITLVGGKTRAGRDYVTCSLM